MLIFILYIIGMIIAPAPAPAIIIISILCAIACYILHKKAIESIKKEQRLHMGVYMGVNTAIFLPLGIIEFLYAIYWFMKKEK